VDVGGTFTDLVAWSASGGALRMLKLPTTTDPSAAVLEGVRRLCAGEELASITHGTTAVTNAMLEGRGARVALVTTRGFRDVLEIGRQQREHLYRLDVPGRTPPLVPRALRFEVSERIDQRGAVLRPLDEADVARVARRIRRAGAEAVAVCLLHAYANPAHERRVGELLAGAAPAVCLSSDVNPEYREYERTHTTCANALLMPLADRYLRALETGLAAAGCAAPLRLMQSTGGMAGAAAMRRAPVSMLMSGPAGGVAAARAVAAQAGIPDAVTLDMGGTSTDVCLVRDGQVETVSERRLAGHPVRGRSLAVESIGAGGGSIVSVTEAGGLRVGPRSAGADPGPACYGRGGEDATVTDAYVVLGYLDPGSGFGGLALDADRAWRAVESVGARVGLPAAAAAWGVLEIADAAMARAIRLVSVQRGHDVRRCCLIAFGGAGPLHAGRLARALGMRGVLVPPYSSAFSAYGCLVADLRYDAVRTARFPLAGTPPDRWERLYAALEADLRRRVERDGERGDRLEWRRTMDLRYAGQNYEIEVPVARGAGAEAVRAAFREVHRRLYDYVTDEPVEAVNLRVAATVPGAVPAAAAASPGARAAAGGPQRERRVYVAGEWLRAAVYHRAALDEEGEVRGPAVVEDEWSTVLVGPGERLRVRGDAGGGLWLAAAP
jgi:N-methylhydantoinase A